MKRIEKRALLLWRIRMSLVALPCPLFATLFFSTSPVWYAALTILWIALFLFFFLFYYPVKYVKLRYRVGSEGLLVECGVFYNRVKAIRLHNVQYCATGETPLQRLLGLCSLSVFGAGGRVALPCLSPEEARALCARLSRAEGREEHG